MKERDGKKDRQRKRERDDTSAEASNVFKQHVTVVCDHLLLTSCSSCLVPFRRGASNHTGKFDRHNIEQDSIKLNSSYNVYEQASQVRGRRLLFEYLICITQRCYCRSIYSLRILVSIR